MLVHHEFEDWLGRLELPSAAHEILRRIRSTPPSRAVSGRRGNVSGRYPSRKMGVTIQFESHRNELAAVYDLEHDANVWEYYDQPGQVKLIYPGPNGRSLGVLHTPDFFVIRHDSAGWEECKPEDELRQLAARSPHRYQRSESSGWRCPPGEAFAAAFGFYYRIRSSAEISWVYQRNIQFLEDYLGDAVAAARDSAKDHIFAAVAARPGIRLSELFEATETEATRDEIYALIAAQTIFADLRSAPLVDPDRVALFAERQIATSLPQPVASASRPVLEFSIGSVVSWDAKAWRVVNASHSVVSLVDNGGTFTELPLHAFESLVRDRRITQVAESLPISTHPEVAQRLARADTMDRRRANRRFELVCSYQRGEALPSDAGVSNRTVRSWVAEFRKAQSAFGCGYVGLLPRHRDRGNRTAKLPEATRSAMDEFIDRDYESLKQKRRYEVWTALTLECESRGLVPPSYKTFCAAVARRPSHTRTLKRKGHRAAYVEEPFYWSLDLQTPRHGDRPFEICHVDHTQLDVELVCSKTGVNLGRPWATFLVDAFSRRLLAIYLTFDPPSYRSCMMVLRECVRRNGRLPQVLVVDGGAEFRSVYFDLLLARHECTKKVRPISKARFGSVCERLFGTANTQFVHNLRGNTQIMRAVRQVTKAVNPKTSAVWTLAHLYESLCEYAYSVYDAASHPALGQAPRDAFAYGMRNFGLRPQRLIAYDQEFLMWTLPTTRKGTAKVLPGRGVKINSILYWNEAFRDSQVERTQVEVRYDPFDAGTAHAFVLGRWVTCFSACFSELHGRSEREIRAASLEIRARSCSHGRSAPVTARRLAEFLRSVETKEEGLLRGLRHREARSIIDSIVSPAVPIAVPNPDRAMADNGQVDQTECAVLGPADDALEYYGDF